MVRPDWYLFGTAADGEELGALLGAIDRVLAQPEPVQG